MRFGLKLLRIHVWSKFVHFQRHMIHIYIIHFEFFYFYFTENSHQNLFLFVSLGFEFYI
ncbi:hypothetical protein Hanom_Chr09g00856271 [Helianthus anomalus]